MTNIFAIAGIALAIPAGAVAARLVRVFAPAPRLDLAMILGCVAIAAWASMVMPADYLLPVTCLLGWTLLTLSAIDVLAFRLPDALTFPLIAAGLIVSALLPERDIAGHAIGAAIGFIFFAGIAWLYRRLRGRDGLGLGDAKLLAACGAWLGWEALPAIVLIGCAAGFSWALAHALMRGREALSARIPFGVALAIAMWIVWLYGPPGFAT